MNQEEYFEMLWQRWSSLTEKKMASKVQELEQISEYNQIKIIRAMHKYHVSDFHFANSTGYGYDDRGRETLDKVYAEVFGTEVALVRPHFVSGTHTLAVTLFGLLKPGDELLYVTGKPYDTMEKVIGSANDGLGSLTEWGVKVKIVPLIQGQIDYLAVQKATTKRTKVFAIQRSRGYEWRSSFTIEQIEEMVKKLREINPSIVIFTDNCYGEFTEMKEPTEVGVDVAAGSLIKNPGGSLAESGGYIAGKADLIKRIADRLTAPGLGGEIGAMLGTVQRTFQGLFLSPQFVMQALRGAIFTAFIFQMLGFKTEPNWDAKRSDLIQAIRFDSQEPLLYFMQAIQSASPINAHVVPEPYFSPGYQDPVIMAAGTFIQGASLELSADAPIRKPYTAYMQGGLTYAHVKYAVKIIIKKLYDTDCLKSDEKGLY